MAATHPGDRAVNTSGVSLYEATEVDRGTSVYETVGAETLLRLATEFYNRVYDDDQQWFKSIFAGIPKDRAIRNQYNFFLKRLGGPPHFRRSIINLVPIHTRFNVSPQAAVRWLEHMSAALDVVCSPGPDGTAPAMDGQTRKKMWDMLTFSAWFLVGAQEMREQLTSGSAVTGDSARAV
ncbi:Two-on-two hemoglobin-3 [Gonapodya sp. JEL0774]|nr:Two-on-two hemoglobin-3 [Gonapodya sp. JEL0774]